MVNKVLLIGNIGKDVEVKQTSSGKDFCVFSLATSQSIKRGEDWDQETTWHNIVFFGPSATKFASNTKTGATVYVEGRISVSTYEDKSGNKVKKTSIIADKVRTLSFKQKEEPSQTNTPDDDVPF